MGIFLLILQALPAILKSIVEVDAAFANRTETAAPAGPMKKQIIMDSVKTAIEVGAKLDPKLVQAISTTVDKVVGVLNTAAVLPATVTAEAKAA